MPASSAPKASRKKPRVSAKSPKHTDGSLCLEGTSRVPKGFHACCAAFAVHTKTCEFDIRYEWWPRPKGWYVVIAEAAGGGGVEIGFCPHCGAKLSSATNR